MCGVSLVLRFRFLGEKLTLYFMLKCESVKKGERDLESAFEVEFANHV